MARPRKRDRIGATDERLIAAAGREFARAGLGSARLEDIARRVGITRPSLLYHFGTKERLYAAVVRRAFDSLRAALGAALADAGAFSARLDRVVQAYLAFLDRNPWVARILLREVLDGRGPGRRLLVTEVGPLLDWLEEFVRAGPPAGAGLPPAFPVRAALLEIAVDALVRAAAGPLRAPLWGADASARDRARRLLLGS